MNHEAQKLINTINNCPDPSLKEIIKKLQHLKEIAPDTDFNKVISGLELPLQYHLFITSSFTTLMKIKLK